LKKYDGDEDKQTDNPSKKDIQENKLNTKEHISRIIIL